MRLTRRGRRVTGNDRNCEIVFHLLSAIDNRGMSSVDLVLRLLLAAGLGAAIGLEREYRQKPAGLRTNMLIALGSALFTILSLKIGLAAGTPDRIVAQVVTGIGFLGGGAILRGRSTIHGMTTAATIWVNAAIGLAAGAGEFAIASTATAITLVVLVLLPPIEAYFERRAGLSSRHDRN
jgi:putative Mg2+ transporter-C (MgtC) family protein